MMDSTKPPQDRKNKRRYPILLIAISVLMVVTQRNLVAQQATDIRVEDGYLTIRIKLDDQVDWVRIRELLKPATPILTDGPRAVLTEYLLNLSLTNQPEPVWIRQTMQNLDLVARINAGQHRPEQIGTLKLRYDLLTGKVTEIGSMSIRYDLMTGQLTQVGDTEIAYDLLTGKVSRIGPLRILWDPHAGSIRSFSETNP